MFSKHVSQRRLDVNLVHTLEHERYVGVLGFLSCFGFCLGSLPILVWCVVYASQRTASTLRRGAIDLRRYMTPRRVLKLGECTCLF